MYIDSSSDNTGKDNDIKGSFRLNNLHINL